MNKVLPAILVVAFAFAIVGCQDEATVGVDLNAPVSKGPAVNVQKKQGGGKADLGTADLQPGMSAAEADARVGSAIK